MRRVASLWKRAGPPPSRPRLANCAPVSVLLVKDTGTGQQLGTGQKLQDEFQCSLSKENTPEVDVFNLFMSGVRKSLGWSTKCVCERQMLALVAQRAQT